MISTQVNISGYVVGEQLYDGSRTLVYRAVRATDNLPVVIKLLKNPYPSFSELVQFRNQYTIAKNLHNPGIIQTYSLKNYQNAYILVMEDFGGVSVKDYFLKNRVPAFDEFLQVAIALCNILDILYHERIIHKDIKPSNILINPKTKQVKLIDFSIASLLPRETQTLVNPNVLEGTLAYISPEQTGRMNRGIDYRTDFYSLGVTFYELLAGVLPFPSHDAMELVHAHIAKIPPLIDEINPDIPPVISAIVSKLMAKNAEDRYQSMLGLKFDLEKCLHQLQTTGEIQSFAIGQRDVCDRFIIPDKLYGRETEVQTLLEAFDRVSQGATEMMLVAGFSGIGKTAVVNEVHKPIVRQRGYFIKGKYDQFNRNIPFSAFVQAFRNLMGQLLCEPDAQMRSWKACILQALGDNAQVIIDVIPELERIIGSQPPAPELSGAAAQNRFNLLFQKFIQVFTTPEHPLVMFLDDLQWADSASLKLMQLLTGESLSGYLLLIGAYRDNEVFPAHPLMLTLEEIRKAQATINTLTLNPLSKKSLNQLVADTLTCAIPLAQPLTAWIYQKTQGNPFFATQFLKSLHQDGLISFDIQAGHWQCDINQIRIASLTDDVVELMAQQLQKLPTETQTVLKLAACIGNSFDLETLAIVFGQSEVETATALWNALKEGLVLPQNEVYKFYLSYEQVDSTPNEIPQKVIYRFLHDRVQQAAYFLIPQEQKPATHYRIGQMLLQQISPAAKEDRIFELVNQLNYGTSLIVQQTEREELAQMNLIACRKARSATAYQAGRDYAKVGLSLLGEQSWQEHYDMTLEFHNLAAELASLCGNFEQMEKFGETIIYQARALTDQVNVYRLRILMQIGLGKPAQAVAIALDILQQFGVTFPEQPTPSDIQQVIGELYQIIAGKNIESFADLPMMTDPAAIGMIEIINSCISAAFVSRSPLMPYLLALPVKLSLLHGNIPDSAIAYVHYAILLCNIQDVDTATEFTQLALQVVDKFDAKAVKPLVLSVMSLFVVHRKSPITATLPLLQEGYTLAMETGNLTVATYNACKFCLHSFWSGQLLAPLEQDARAYSKVMIQFNQQMMANATVVYWQATLNLLGSTSSAIQLQGEALQEAEFLPQMQSVNDGFALFNFHLVKLMLGYWFGDMEQAQSHTTEAKRYLIANVGLVTEPAFYLYDSLTALAQVSQQNEPASDILERVSQNQLQLQQHWASHAPMNYQHKFDLVEAEQHRVLGHLYEAAESYDRAIAGAKANGYIQEEALGNELAAKFYLNLGRQTAAIWYVQEAYYCYAKWGAKAKTDDLEKRYPQLLKPILEQRHITLNPWETIAPTISPLTSATTQSSSSNFPRQE